MTFDPPIINDEMRAAGRAVLDRMATDEDYAARLVEDPAPLLREAGIPENVVPALAAGIIDNAEVSGFSFSFGGGHLAPGTEVQTIGTSGTSVIAQATYAQTISGSYGRSFWYG